MNKLKNCLIQAKLLWFLNEKKKRENVIFFVCKQIPEEIKQKNSLAMLSVLKRFSRIFSVRLKNNGYTIWFTSYLRMKLFINICKCTSYVHQWLDRSYSPITVCRIWNNNEFDYLSLASCVSLLKSLLWSIQH